MKKIKVVRLAGCSWCEALIEKLDAHKMVYETIDADQDSRLADQLEDLLNTEYYPIIILETDELSTYIFRPTKMEDTGYTSLGSKVGKIGCHTIEAMFSQI